MSIAVFRKSRLRFATVIVVLGTYLAMLFPATRASAAPSDAVGGVELGTGGAPSLAGPTPGGNNREALASVDLATGTARSSYTFQLPQARGEAQPFLGLRYDSSAGLGFAGMGWTLNLPSIVRRGHSGIPRFQDAASVEATTLATDYGTDDYYFNGQLLILVDLSPSMPAALPRALASPYGGIKSFGWALFRTEIDDGARYFFDGLTWVRQTKSGHLIQFGVPLDGGLTAGVELADPVSAVTVGNSLNGLATNPIYRWNIVRDTDPTGNTVYYAYDDEHSLFPSGVTATGFGIQYVTDIYDTSAQVPTTVLTSAAPPTGAFAHHVRLSWSLAQYPDPGSGAGGSSTPPYAYSPIWRALPYAQLSTVDVTSATFTSPTRQLVRRYQLAYTYNDTLTRAYLKSVQETGTCLNNGGAIVEQGGLIGSDPVTMTKLSLCTANERMPATTYTYYGISNSTPTSLQAPTLLVRDAGFPPGPIGLLADLDGDAVAEIVSGNLGFGVSKLVNNSGYMVPDTVSAPAPACNFSCTSDASVAFFMALEQSVALLVAASSNAWNVVIYQLVNLAQNGLPIPSNCSGCLIAGPTTQGVPTYDYFGTPIGYWTSNPIRYNDSAASVPQLGPKMVTTLFVDDALWGYSILGDWTSSGANNLLDLMYLPSVHDLWFHPNPPGFNAVSVAQFANVSPQTTGQIIVPPQLQLLSLPQSDVDHLELLNGTVGNHPYGSGTSPIGAPGGLRPSTAVDVDGDGLPDIAIVGSVSSNARGNLTGFYSPYVTIRDRQGTTHPFTVTAPKLCAPASYDPATWLPADSRAIRAFADMDGDGLADLVVLNKSTSTLSANSSPYTYMNFDVLPSRGDGRFGIPTSAPSCNPSYGGGLPSQIPGAGAHSQSDPLGIHSYTTKSSAVRFGDLNGDGLADYAVLDPDGLHVCLRYGATWDNARYHCVTEGTLPGTDQADTTTSAQANILIGDLDGSGINRILYVSPTQGGKAEVVVNPATGAKITEVAAPGPPQHGMSVVRAVTPSQSIMQGYFMRDGLLKTVSDGLGMVITFDLYETVSNMNIGKLPVPAWAVRQVTTNNSLTGSQAISIQKNYSYDGPIYDPRDREFIGFRKITETTANDVTSWEVLNGKGRSPGRVVTTTFATQTCQFNSSCSTPSTDYSLFHASRGLPAFVEVSENDGLGGAGTRFSTTIMYYSFQTPYKGLDGRAGKSILSLNTDLIPWPEGTQPSRPLSVQPIPLAGFPSLSLSVPAGSTYSDIRHSVLYDGNGNKIIDVDAGMYGADQPITRQFSWNLPSGDATGWNWRMTQELVGYGSGTLSPGAAGVREYDRFYDSLGRLIWTAAPISNTSTLTSNQSVMPNRPPPLCGNSGCSGSLVHLVLQYYDAYGNVKQVGDEQNASIATLQYDGSFHQLMTDVTVNAPQGPLDTIYSYDRGLAAETSESTPDHQMTRLKYDDFGRVVEVDAPSPATPMMAQTQATVTYDDTGPARHVHFENADGYNPNGGTPVPGAFVKHDRYIDCFGDTLAAIDQVAGTPAEGTQWLISGVHSNYTNGRVSLTYRPSSMADGTVPTPGSLPSGVSTPNGIWTPATFTYDGLGRAIRGTDFLGQAWQKIYHTAALSVDTYDQEQLGGSHTSSYTTVIHDGHGRVANITRHNASSSGNDIVATYFYQATGEPTAITNGGETRTIGYDSLGRMVTNSEPNAGTWHYTYDFAGRLTGTSDARGCGQNIWYDNIGRMIARDYVPCHPSTPPINPGQSQAAYSAPTVDSSGALTGDGTEAFYTYDPAGRLADVKDLAKHDVYGYDARGRISTIQRSIVAPPANWVYGNFVGSTTLSDRYASNVFTKRIGYDFSDRVISETSGATAPQVTAMGNTETRTYSFDGRLQSVALTGGSTPVTFLQSSAVGYATNGSATATQVLGDVAATKAVSTIAVDGALSTYHLFRSAATQWPVVSPPASNDPSNLTQQTDLLNLTILRDRVGNPTSIGDSSASTWPSGAAAVSQAFTYGNDYRLTRATSNAGNDPFVSPTAPEERPGYAYPNAFGTFQTQGISTRFKGQNFSYDARGNFVYSTDDLNDFWDRSLGTQVCSATPIPPGQYTFGPDQLAKASEPSTSHYNTLFTSTDPAGNVVGIVLPVGNTAVAFYYAYDEVGRLNWGQSWEPEAFIYDADGRRVLSTHYLEGYTLYVFDSLVLHNATFANGVYQDDATTEQVYVAGGLGHVFYDSSNVLPKVNNNQTHAFMTLGDGRGSGGVVIDHDSGEVVERMAYQPYGNPDADYRPARWNYNYERIKFGGHWDAKEIELVDMGARFYSPQLGRFMSPDPLWVHGLAGDPNPYEYANGNPIRFTDPSGLNPWQDFATGAFVALTAFDLALLGSQLSGGAGDGSGGGNGDATGQSGGSVAGSAAAGGLAYAVDSGFIDHLFGISPGVHGVPNVSAAVSGVGPASSQAADAALRGARGGPDLRLAGDWLPGQVCDETGCHWNIELYLPFPEVGANVGALAWIRSLLGLGGAVEAPATTLTEAVGNQETANLVKQVLRGRQGLDALNPAARQAAAQFYRQVATRVVGNQAEAARLFNVARADFLEGVTDTPPGTLPEFIARMGLK